MTIKGRIVKLEAAVPVLRPPPWISEGREPKGGEDVLWVIQQGVSLGHLILLSLDRRDEVPSAVIERLKMLNQVASGRLALN